MAVESDWHSPAPKLLTMRRAEVATTTLVVAAAAFVGLVFASVLAAVLAGAGVVVVGAAALWFVTRRVRAWAYAERADDLVVKRGVMFSRLSVIPYGRMQFIDVTAGPVERVFGLATVRMHTAAAASDARIPGLAADEAGRLRDRLAELGEAQAAGL
ncbi:MAG: PH domain-containing protein [Actinomycetota bacterium]